MLGNWTVSILSPLVLLPLVYAHGSVVFSDDFSYPDGPLVTVSDGRWKTHSGTVGQVEVVSGQISLSQKKSEDVNAPFPDGPIGPIQALAMYAGFKVNFSTLPTGANGTYFAHFKDTTATTGLRCRIFASTNGAPSGSFRLGIAAATNTATSMLARDLELHTVYQVTCRMLLGNNSSTLWVQPNAETDPGTTSTDEATPKPAVAFAFRESLAGGGMGELTVDDLVVATTFAEVHPAAPASPPLIVIQPLDQTVVQGTDVVLTTQASGTAPVSYQWFFNGTVLPLATDPVLRLTHVSEENAGVYEVRASNRAGSVTSTPATLTIEPAVLTLAIQQIGPSGIELHWTAERGAGYSVWAADSPTAEYFVVAEGLAFPDGCGLFEDWFIEAERFYRLSCP